MLYQLVFTTFPWAWHSNYSHFTDNKNGTQVETLSKNTRQDSGRAGFESGSVTSVPILRAPFLSVIHT